ncbi:MAG: SMC-Scp complex subunit ScpB [Thermoanaerobaculia bacterium]|nr:SMC-Scp complex subunit ScpB [Thermoanaerobaculia bacterium]
MEQNEIRSAIEAILVASPDPVSPGELSTSLEVPQRDVDEQIEEIQKSLERSVGGFRLERAGGGVRLATRPEYDEQLRKFFSRKRENRMSLAALETLSIIAYRQPITGPEVSELRGVNSAGVLRTLLERRMIRIAGRKNVVGSPFLYRTTKEFLLHFGLERIQDLPKLEEFGEILGEQVDEDLGLAELTAEVEAAEESRESEVDGRENLDSEDEVADRSADSANEVESADAGTHSEESEESLETAGEER